MHSKALRRLFSVSLALTSLGWLGACGDDEGPSTPEPVALSFALVAGGEPVSCGDATFTAGTESAQVTLTDARFYLSELVLMSGTTETVVTLDSDDAWQNGTVALLDFEDSTGPCINGSADLRDVVSGVVAPGRYDSVAFTIGVPFELNHADAGTALAPLSFTSMFWSWQAGYKFIRFEANVDGTDATRLHLGSTGCEGSLTNVTSCTRPNRARIALSDFDVETDTILIDLEALLADVSLAQNTPDTALGCMSAPDDPECDGMMGALGIDVETGVPTGNQTVFSVAPR
ncbi:MAG: putative repeat protein (TIGR04052 family) [Bradymonadia bacterium]|jgi:uncharacterized repeat protein (TIGR04052 family)